MAEAPLSFVTRLWFAWVCFFRVLFDGAFAARAFAVQGGMPEAPALPGGDEAAGEARGAPLIAEKAGPESDAKGRAAAAQKEAALKEAARKEAALKEAARKEAEVAERDAAKAAQAAAKVEAEAPSVTAALQLLALFQREGRLVDFLEQDVASYSDADVGAAARVVHEGCRKALRQHAKMSAVRSEEEGAQVTIGEGYDAHEVKLVGNVTGKPPYKGVLRHKGWRLRELSVPTPTKEHDATVIAPAEVEL